METGVTIPPHPLISFEMRQTIRASLTAIFDIGIEHLRFLFDEDQESRIERIQRAIRDNEPHHHWNSVTEMYRAYEGSLRDRCRHIFLGGRMAADESDSPSAAHRGAFAMETMMRDVTTAQPVGNALGEDIAGHSTGQPSTDLRNEDPGMSLSPNDGRFGHGNDVTSVDPMDAIGQHPESYSSGDGAHWRTEGGEERDRFLRRGHSIANGPERQTPEDRNRRLLYHISLLMEIARSDWHPVPSDTSTSQVRNDSNAPLRMSQVDSSMSLNSLIMPEGDSGTPSPREEDGGPGGRGGRGGDGRYPQDSQPWIHNFAVSHPSIREPVPLRPPPHVPTQRLTQRRTFRPRERRLRQTPPEAPTRPSSWMPNVDTGVRRRNEEPRFVGATGQGHFDTVETPFGRELFSLPLFVEC